MESLKAAIAEGRDLVKLGDSAAAKRYVRRMAGVLDGVVQNPKSGLHMYKSRMNGTPAYTLQDIYEDVKTIIARIEIVVEGEQRKFDERYGCTVVSSYIRQCEKLLEDDSATDEDANKLGWEIFSIYDSKIEDFDNSIGNRRDSVIRSFNKTDLPLIRGKLMEYRDEIVRSANSGASPATVNVAQSNHQSVSIAVDLNVAMSQMWALPDSVLTANEKMELAKLLNELEESKGKGKTKVKKAAKAVGNWLFDKAIEAVPTVMPFVAQSIQTAMGA